MLQMVPGNLVIEVSRDPGMLQRLVDSVSHRGLRMTELFDETLLNGSEFAAESQPLEFDRLLLILLLFFPSDPERMLPGDELIHDKSHCPYVDSLTIELTTGHLLGSLVDQSSARFIHTLSGLVLHSEPEVHNFHRFQVTWVRNHNVTWFEIPMHVVIVMDVLEALKYTSYDFGEILILQLDLFLLFLKHQV